MSSEIVLPPAKRLKTEQARDFKFVRYDFVVPNPAGFDPARERLMYSIVSIDRSSLIMYIDDAEERRPTFFLCKIEKTDAAPLLRPTLRLEMVGRGYLRSHKMIRLSRSGEVFATNRQSGTFRLDRVTLNAAFESTEVTSPHNPLYSLLEQQKIHRDALNIVQEYIAPGTCGTSTVLASREMKSDPQKEHELEEKEVEIITEFHEGGKGVICASDDTVFLVHADPPQVPFPDLDQPIRDNELCDLKYGPICKVHVTEFKFNAVKDKLQIREVENDKTESQLCNYSLQIQPLQIHMGHSICSYDLVCVVADEEFLFLGTAHSVYRASRKCTTEPAAHLLELAGHIEHMVLVATQLVITTYERQLCMYDKDSMCKTSETEIPFKIPYNECTFDVTYCPERQELFIASSHEVLGVRL